MDYTYYFPKNKRFSMIRTWKRYRLKNKLENILLRVWTVNEVYARTSGSKLLPVLAALEISGNFLYMVIVLPVGMSPEKVERVLPQLSYALGGPVRIQTLSQGKILLKRPLTGIPQVVSWDPPKLSGYRIPVWLGITEEGNKIIDLGSDRTHGLLIGGLPGTGKSNFIKSLLHGLREGVLIHGIDLKGGIELITLRNHPCMHTLGYTLEDTREVIGYLCRELSRREKMFREEGITSVQEAPDLDRHLLVIDEYADITDTKNQDLERQIFKILRKGRALGISAVIATQKPTNDVISVTLRNMFPASLAFRTATDSDSRVILNGLDLAARLPLVPGRGIFMQGPLVWEVQTPYVDM